MLRKLSKIYCLSEKMVSYRVIDMPVLEIEKQFAKTQELLAKESMAAFKEDGADVIIFGCTGFLGCAELIRARLADHNLSVSVIDPIPLTV